MTIRFFCSRAARQRPVRYRGAATTHPSLHLLHKISWVAAAGSIARCEGRGGLGLGGEQRAPKEVEAGREDAEGENVHVGRNAGHGVHGRGGGRDERMGGEVSRAAGGGSRCIPTLLLSAINEREEREREEERHDM